MATAAELSPGPDYVPSIPSLVHFMTPYPFGSTTQSPAVGMVAAVELFHYNLHDRCIREGSDMIHSWDEAFDILWERIIRFSSEEFIKSLEDFWVLKKDLRVELIIKCCGNKGPT